MKRIVLSIAALLCLAVPALSAAATFTVNTTADGPVVGTCVAGETCTLRDALAVAEGSSDPENQVVLPAGDYKLTEGELELGGPTTLAGAGARSTVIDGQGTSRVFATNGAPALSGVTVTGGNSTLAEGGEFAGDGGGIFVFGTLKLTNVAVIGNTAAMNGGGVSAPPESGNAKTVTIENSTIAGNHVAGGTAEGLGGGIYVLGNLSITNSTVTGNTAENTAALNEGGGILAGPAPASLAGTMTQIVNSTIAGNSVAAGGTGGGIATYNVGATIEPMSTITNTIVAGNTAGTAVSNCGGAAGTVTSTNNLSGDPSCGFTDAGSKVNTDPKLGTLANNGGQTDTLALLVGSPAIDSGTSVGCPPTDQRGVARPVGAACDIGAYEFQPTPPAKGGGAPGTGGAVASADLSLKIKAKPKKPVRGKKLAFVVTVRDAGPAAATGVVFKGTVPAAALKIKGKGLGKKACKLGKAKKGHRAVTCKLGAIAVGTTKSFRVRVRTAAAPKKLVVRGRVRSGVVDPTLKNAKAKAVAKLAS